MAQLKVAQLGVEGHLVCLEALARLAWSDDSVRELVANSGGIKSLVEVMALHAGGGSQQYSIAFPAFMSFLLMSQR